MSKYGEVTTVMKDTFEFRTNRNGFKADANDMADYSTIKSHLDAHKIPYYAFHPKLLKPVKAVIQQLTEDTPAEDITNELVTLGRQMTATPPHHQGGRQTFTIPSFFVTSLETRKQWKYSN